VHLVEISPVLEQRQRQAFRGLDVPVEWHKSLDQVLSGPSILLANEFFDALPIQQAVMCVDGWHERVIRVGDSGNFQFGISRDPIPLFEQMLPPEVGEAEIGDIFEWRSDQTALELGRRVFRSEGAALIIDYGHTVSATGNTLQAVGSHLFSDPLSAPGEVDLTAHVDFQALVQAAESMNVKAYGPVDQAAFLEGLGIETRAAILKRSQSPEKATDIDLALARLTHRSQTGMGRLFKAVGLAHPKLGPLPALT
jgi:SAM-dependent MidA family methyltransferase